MPGTCVTQQTCTRALVFLKTRLVEGQKDVKCGTVSPGFERWAKNELHNLNPPTPRAIQRALPLSQQSLYKAGIFMPYVGTEELCPVWPLVLASLGATREEHLT